MQDDSTLFSCDEVWRNVPGYEDVSVSNKNGFKRNNTTYCGHINRGYRNVSLGRKRGQMRYHILVAKAFPEICGEWFEGCEVHHKDFNKLNNVPENLIILSKGEHSKLHYQYLSDAFKKPSPKRNESIRKALTGRRATEKHIPILQYALNGDLVKEWECISDVVSAGYRPGNVCWCCKGRLKTAYGYIWRYKEKEGD